VGTSSSNTQIGFIQEAAEEILARLVEILSGSIEDRWR